MTELIIANFYPIAAAILLACFVGYINWRNNLKVRQADAASEFRNIINISDYSTYSGHALVNALTVDFPTQKAAVHEFRIHLNPIQRFSFNKAWNAYHGGNENAPDFLVLYGIPKNGNEILKHNLNALLEFSENP